MLRSRARQAASGYMANHPLAKVLEQRKISQEKLGMACGVAPDKVSKFIHWQQYPYPKARAAISSYLSVPEFELFPHPSDLINMIQYLTEENAKLTALLAERNGTPSQQSQRIRDNSSFL